MFGLSPLTYFRIAGVVAIIAIVAGCVWYYKWAEAEIIELNKNNALLETHLQQSEQAIKSLQNSVAESKEKLTVVQSEFSNLRRENNSLSKKLSKHDIGHLASRKPGLMEKVFSKGTDDSGRCYELVTGAKHTEAELSATKPSQVNKSCPRLANPNFKGEL